MPDSCLPIYKIMIFILVEEKIRLNRRIVTKIWTFVEKFRVYGTRNVFCSTSAPSVLLIIKSVFKDDAWFSSSFAISTQGGFINSDWIQLSSYPCKMAVKCTIILVKPHRYSRSGSTSWSAQAQAQAQAQEDQVLRLRLKLRLKKLKYSSSNSNTSSSGSTS